MTGSPDWRLSIGATPDAHGTRFRVWAADARQVELVLLDGDRILSTHALASDTTGYFSGFLPGVRAGTQYLYRVDGGEPRPDPASRFQPAGVHGPSCIVDPQAFEWSDGGWRGLPLSDLLIYEVHVGAATTEGTFDALITRLDDLRELGITAIQLMPIGDFPGSRNWGYDGVCLFAPARCYGGPDGLKRLVDAAHARGLAVLLDVVYNHFGPDGNYLRQFSGAYFTGRHTTPWGEALNFDGPGSGPVRAFFVANACYWMHEYHIDGLRLDATHAMIDDNQPHILAEIQSGVRATLRGDRHFVLIAEDERNLPRLVRPVSEEGYGLDGVWADDFHHQLRVALAGDRDGYYADYSGAAAEIAETLQRGWFYVGQQSVALGHPRGAPPDDLPYSAFVHCIQNHDQVGNRAFGDRLHQTAGLAAYRAASALLLLDPATPLLFMGQECAASTPFQYFTDHHPELGRLVTQGRRAEFAAFAAFAGAAIPDPQDEATFLGSKLRWEERDLPRHAGVLRLYGDLLALRRSHPALQERSRASVAVTAPAPQTVLLHRQSGEPERALLVVVQLGGVAQLTVGADLPAPPDGFVWSVLLDTEADVYGGAGALTVSVGSGWHLGLDGPRALVLQLVGERPAR